MLRTATFNRARLGEGCRGRVPGRDRHRRPARAPGCAFPRIAWDRRGAGAPCAGARKKLSDLVTPRVDAVLRLARRRLLRGACGRVVAGVEGLRGRHFLGARPATRLMRARRCWRSSPLVVPKRETRMIPLGYGKLVRADRIYALVPIEAGERGDGRRTYVHVDGLSEPLVASRSERAILTDVEAALHGGGRDSTPDAPLGPRPGQPVLACRRPRASFHQPSTTARSTRSPATWSAAPSCTARPRA